MESYDFAGQKLHVKCIFMSPYDRMYAWHRGKPACKAMEVTGCFSKKWLPSKTMYMANYCCLGLSHSASSTRECTADRIQFFLVVIVALFTHVLPVFAHVRGILQSLLQVKGRWQPVLVHPLEKWNTKAGTRLHHDVILTSTCFVPLSNIKFQFTCALLDSCFKSV